MKSIILGIIFLALLVGGAPIDMLKGLNRVHKLLSISEGDVAKLKNIYKPATLSYSNLGSAGIQTVSIDSVRLARDYKTQKMIDQLAQLKSVLIQQFQNWLKLQEHTRLGQQSRLVVNQSGHCTHFKLRNK